MGIKQLTKTTLLRNGLLVQRVPRVKSHGVYFLHIGKTAGTQINQLSVQINALQRNVAITSMTHEVLLANLPQGSPYFFSIRDPIARFRSGFYDRKRMGRPRYFTPWSSDEEIVFKDFPHANDLAEALFRSDEMGAKAFMAMESLHHVSSHQVDWFRGEGNFLVKRPPIHIVRQEFFAQDFAHLMRKLSLPFEMESLSVIRDARTGHSHEYGEVPELSRLARENLHLWFARDFEFYRLCSDWCESS
jgi:hypothetical protein